MDRGVKMVIASAVLLAGIAAAMLFRRSPRPARPPEPGSQGHLVLRHESDLQGGEPSVPDPPTAQIEPSATGSGPLGASVRPPGSLAPMERGEPPPRLARSYPHFPDSTASPWSRSTRPGLPHAEASAGPLQTHKVVDGDTLRALAERYLGEADRYLEIYEANRDLLPGPEVLPIGVELKIPPREKRGPSSPSLTSP